MIMIDIRYCLKKISFRMRPDPSHWTSRRIQAFDSLNEFDCYWIFLDLHQTTR